MMITQQNQRPTNLQGANLYKQQVKQTQALESFQATKSDLSMDISEDMISNTIETNTTAQDAFVPSDYWLTKEALIQTYMQNQGEETAVLMEDAQNMDHLIEAFKSQLESSCNEIEMYTEMMQHFIECVKIAGRIMNGDKVPNSDVEFLLKNEPSLYTQATQLSLTAESNKEHEKVVAKENNQPFAEDDEKEREKVVDTIGIQINVATEAISKGVVSGAKLE